MCVYRYIFLLAYALNSGGAFAFLAESIVTKIFRENLPKFNSVDARYMSLRFHKFLTGTCEGQINQDKITDFSKSSGYM